MSTVTQERPATVPGCQARRPARAVEVRITHKRDGAWEIERESESHSGLMYLIHVTNTGQASHEDGPSCPVLRCEANAHGRPCRHLADAPALVEMAELVTELLIDIATERSDYVIGESQGRIIECRERIDNAVWDAEDRYGVRITKVVEEALL